MYTQRLKPETQGKRSWSLITPLIGKQKITAVLHGQNNTKIPSSTAKKS